MSDLSTSFVITEKPESWRITVRAYELDNSKAVYQALVKQRFPAVFLDPKMLTGNPLDLRIGTTKALSRQSRATMITKSLPMEVLYAISPRTGISDSLKYFGFKPTCSAVLVVWIHQTAEPPEDQTAAFGDLISNNGRQVPLEQLQRSSDFGAIAEVYDFPCDIPSCSKEEWKALLFSYVTSRIAIKE